MRLVVELWGEKFFKNFVCFSFYYWVCCLAENRFSGGPKGHIVIFQAITRKRHSTLVMEILGTDEINELSFRWEVDRIFHSEATINAIKKENFEKEELEGQLKITANWVIAKK
ncbi:MAG: hypothetical protein LBR92_04050 [Puniceicoccales bacterium]|jgi:hypothetical protein|nr:hypothetical protein [Puniceicoccales bacterium]